MNLNNPESRRALRTLLLCVIAIALLYFVYDAISRLRDEHSLLEVARDCLIIIGLFVLGVITENVGRVSVDIASIKASMGCDQPPDGNA